MCLTRFELDAFWSLLNVCGVRLQDGLVMMSLVKLSLEPRLLSSLLASLANQVAPSLESIQLNSKGMTRDDLFNTNASIVKNLAAACAQY